MRKFSRVALFSVCLFAGALSAQAQKFGHIDFQQLVQLMPEKDVAQKAITKVETELKAQSDAIAKEYQDKMKDYVAQQKTLNDAIRAAKEDELQSIQARAQTFQQQAQETMDKEQTKQFQPIIEKARKAIGEVAKEQGLLYVFEVNNGGLLYHSDQSMELLPLVKTKLGIK